MSEKHLDLGEGCPVTAWASWRTSPLNPDLPDPVILIAWSGTKNWLETADLIDRMLASYATLPGIMLDDNMMLGSAEFNSGETKVGIELTGQTFSDADGHPVKRFVERLEGLYPDRRNGLFEPAGLPFRIFASATDRFGDATCTLAVEFEEAEEILNLPSLQQWLTECGLGSEQEVRLLLSRILSEVTEYFDEDEAESGVETDLESGSQYPDEADRSRPTVRRPPTF